MPGEFKNSKLPAPALHDARNRNIWPEQLYRYVEHYFWEPQHLIKTPRAAWEAGKRGETSKEAFYRLIRTQEVPLNFTLNLVLRIAPDSVKRAFLQRFRINETPMPLGSLKLLYAEDQKFTQPDILLKTESQRFFIELKVSGSGSTDQLEKYAQLHAHLDQSESPLEPHVYFLTPGPIERAWIPKADRAPILRKGFQSFVRDALVRRGSSSRQPLGSNRPSFEDAYASVVNLLYVGHATWQAIGECLQQERDHRLERGGEVAEMMHALLSDFLLDLEARGLWKS